jgi:hypothetical protein
MDRALPNFIIIGAMKCATSTLHEQLARQPGVFMSEPKEPNFFSDDDVYARGPDYYRGLFATAGAATLRGESSTHYTKLPTYPQTLTRMRRLLPELKLIYVMRHPIERLVSHYIHEWSMRNVTAPIEQAVDTHPHLVDYGCYHMQLAPFIDAYGRGNVLPMFMERFKDHSQAELERVCRFLGFEGTPIWFQEVARQNVSNERLRLGKLGRELFDHPTLTTLRRRLVPHFVRDALKEQLTMRDRPQLSAAKTAELTARYDADLARLGRDLGVSLSCENYRSRVKERTLDWVT